MNLNIMNSSKSLNRSRDKYPMKINFSINDLPTSSNRFKNNLKKLSFIPINPNNSFKNAFLSTFNKSISNNGLTKTINIHDKVQEYTKHPYRRVNLKIIGEDIRLKLKEMNEENFNSENEKIISSPTETKKLAEVIRNKYNIPTIEENNIDFNYSSYNAHSNKKTITGVYNSNFPLFEKKIENEKVGSCSHVIKIKIPKHKFNDIQENEKNNNEIEKVEGKINNNLENKSFSTKYMLKFRQIQRKKNLYDSMDDNESEEEVDGDIINPETKLILIFDLLIIIFYLYNFFILTFNLAQTNCFCSFNKLSFTDIMFYLNDILYIFDLSISFFRSYYNYEFKLVKEKKLIINNYLTGDFILDLLEAVPIFSIYKYICYKIKNYNNYYCYSYEMTSSFFILKAFSILKVFKIIKILGRKKNQALDAFLELISENYAFERTTLLIIDSLIFVGIIHCFVCFHIFIGKHSFSNWLIKTNSENESFLNLYIESLYFLVTTITTVGYGDITCSSFGERIFQILLLAVGSIFYSFIISTIGNYIKNDSHAKIKYNDDLNILENIRIAYPNMPFKLYKNLNRYLENKTNSQEKYDVNSLIDTLPFTLKNTILFTMYKSAIKNFKFFKKNDNSEFIAQVLTNFITFISKKNEFLVYEGEMIEEIIFIKDGRISLNAAINLEAPSKSIYNYFNEKFIPFTSDEEKKLFESRINEKTNKSGFVSMMNGEISYDTAKSKINNALKTLKKKPSAEDKSFFTLNNISISEKKEDLGKFDINGGAIRNEEGNHQYLKILDIRKNEHFGLVFMTLKRPCPLSLQVKSKFAELYFFKKEDAVATSKSYPNIWKKLYQKEFHNLRAIKNLTFKALKKYIELNQLLLDLDLGEVIAKNELTVNDLNEIEKSLFLDKSVSNNPIFQNRKSINSKKRLSNKSLTKYRTMNSELDKKNGKSLSLGKIHVQNHKDKISKFKGGNLYSNSIIYSHSNKDKMMQLWNNKINNNSNNGNNNPFLSIKKHKAVKFADDCYINKNSKNENNLANMKQISNSELYTTQEYESEKKSKLNRNNPRDKLRKLKNFLIKYKKKLKIGKYEENKSLQNNDINPNVKARKGILKKNSDVPNNKGITNTFNIKNIDDPLIQELNNFCNEESNFSFCSINNENKFNMKNLSISKDIDIEILSSYRNLNQLSKGKYIYDNYFQDKIKFKIRKYYSKKHPNVEYSLSLNSLSFSSESNKHKKKRFTFTGENIKKHRKKNSKQKFLNICPGSHKLLDAGKKITEIKKKKFYPTDTNNKSLKFSSLKDYKISNQSTFKNEKSSFLKNNQNNMTFFPHNFHNISEQNSIKVNISELDEGDSNHNIKNDLENQSKSDSLNINIKKNKQIFNQTEAEYEINKTFNKINLRNKNEHTSDNEKIKMNNNYNNIYNHNKHNKIKYRNNKNKMKNSNNERKIINQILGIQIPNANIITNNITTTSSKHIDNKDNFNTNEKINNIEASFSIYNIIQKNVNKNLNIIDNKDKFRESNINKTICGIY